MGTYQSSRTIGASADQLFDYLSEVENLPKYMPGMVEAHRTSGEEVAVTAKVDADRDPSTPKEDFHGTAWFRTDDSARTISWGSEGPNDYHGELRVTEASSGADGGSSSTVEVTLHTENVEGSDIDRDLERMLRTVQEQVEG